MWLMVAVLGAIIAVAVIFWPRVPPQIITLSNGDQYKFAGVTYGTNLVPPSPLCRIANRLPSGLTNVAAKLLGSRIMWNKWSTPDGPAVIVWFKRIKTEGPILPGSADSLRTRVANQSGFETDLTGFLNQRYYTPYYKENGWTHVELMNFPRRDPVFTLIFYQRTNSVGQKVIVPNPLFREYPQWQPKDTLPTNLSVDGVQVEVDKLEYRYSSGALRFPNEYASLQGQVSWDRRGISSEINILSVGLYDATGNHLNEILLHVGSTPPKYLDFPVGFWPGENAWRLKLVFERTANFPPESVLTFKDVPIPPIGSTNFIPITKTLGGVKVRISQFIHATNSEVAGKSSYSHIVVDLPDHPSDLQPSIIDLNTAFGKPISIMDNVGAWPLAFPNYIPTNATKMDVTVLLRKLTTVELYIKPPKP